MRPPGTFVFRISPPPITFVCSITEMLDAQLTRTLSDISDLSDLLTSDGEPKAEGIQ